MRIGVYEPLILRVDGQVRNTAIAADPSLCAWIGEHYHRACYSAQFDDYAFAEP